MPIKKILVVDDSPTERQFMLEALSGLGYQVVLAESGEEGVAKARSEMPELVLMDVVMPGSNQLRVTRQIARDDTTKHIPVIICTTKSRETDRIWGMRQGARDYIVKPVNVDELAAKIAALG